MSVAKVWADAQANAQKILGKDGKLPKMPVELDKLVDDYNRSLDDMKPSITNIGEAWTQALGKAEDISKGCNSISKAVQGDDFGLDSKDPAQAKKQKAAMAVLTNALTAIKGTTFANKQKNVSWVMKQVQSALK
jgi:hypothetical protein